MCSCFGSIRTYAAATLEFLAGWLWYFRTCKGKKSTECTPTEKASPSNKENQITATEELLDPAHPNSCLA